MHENEQHGAVTLPGIRFGGQCLTPSLPARVCVCVTESESLTTSIVADVWTLLSKWHGYSYLPPDPYCNPCRIYC